jgi:hypothetical protein
MRVSRLARRAPGFQRNRHIDRHSLKRRRQSVGLDRSWPGRPCHSRLEQSRGTRRRRPAPSPSSPALTNPNGAQVQSLTRQTPPPNAVISRTIVVPTNSYLSVRLTEDITTKTAKPSDHFHGTIAAAVLADGMVAIPAGTPVLGRADRIRPPLPSECRNWAFFHSPSSVKYGPDSEECLTICPKVDNTSSQPGPYCSGSALGRPAAFQTGKTT